MNLVDELEIGRLQPGEDIRGQTVLQYRSTPAAVSICDGYWNVLELVACSLFGTNERAQFATL